jgi:hypothetical protein
MLPIDEQQIAPVQLPCGQQSGKRADYIPLNRAL